MLALYRSLTPTHNKNILSLRIQIFIHLHVFKAIQRNRTFVKPHLQSVIADVALSWVQRIWHR